MSTPESTPPEASAHAHLLLEGLEKSQAKLLEVTKTLAKLLEVTETLANTTKAGENDVTDAEKAQVVKEALANTQAVKEVVKEAVEIAVKQALANAFVERVEKSIARLDPEKANEATLNLFIDPMLQQMIDLLEQPILNKISDYNAGKTDESTMIPDCKIMCRSDRAGDHLLNDQCRPDSCVGIWVEKWRLFFPLLTSEYKVTDGAPFDFAMNQTLGVNSFPFPYLELKESTQTVYYQTILLVRGLEAYFIVRHINHPATLPAEKIQPPNPPLTSKHPMLFASTNIGSPPNQFDFAAKMAETIVGLFNAGGLLPAKGAKITFRDSGASTGVYDDRVLKTHSYGSQNLAEFHLGEYQYFFAEEILNPFYPNPLITGPHEASTTEKQKTSLHTTSQSVSTQSLTKASFSTRFLFTVCLQKKPGTDLGNGKVAPTTAMMKETMSQVGKLHLIHKVAHNDIRLVNVILSDTKIMLIDFEYAVSQGGLNELNGLNGLDKVTFQQLLIELSRLKTYANFYGVSVPAKANAAQIEESVKHVQTQLLNNIQTTQNLNCLMVLVDLWSVVSMFNPRTAQALLRLDVFQTLVQSFSGSDNNNNKTVQSIHSSFKDFFELLEKNRGFAKSGDFFSDESF